MPHSGKLKREQHATNDARNKQTISRVITSQCLLAAVILRVFRDWKVTVAVAHRTVRPFDPVTLPAKITFLCGHIQLHCQGNALIVFHPGGRQLAFEIVECFYQQPFLVEQIGAASYAAVIWPPRRNYQDVGKNKIWGVNWWDGRWKTRKFIPYIVYFCNAAQWLPPRPLASRLVAPDPRALAFFNRFAVIYRHFTHLAPWNRQKFQVCTATRGYSPSGLGCWGRVGTTLQREGRGEGETGHCQ